MKNKIHTVFYWLLIPVLAGHIISRYLSKHTLETIFFIMLCVCLIVYYFTSENWKDNLKKYSIFIIIIIVTILYEYIPKIFY